MRYSRAGRKPGRGTRSRCIRSLRTPTHSADRQSRRVHCEKCIFASLRPRHAQMKCQMIRRRQVAGDARLKRSASGPTGAEQDAVLFPWLRDVVLCNAERTIMSTSDPHPHPDTSDHHRRGSTPAVKEPSEPRDEQGRSLPPHMHTGPIVIPVLHAPRRPRSKRLLTVDVAQRPLDPVVPSADKGDPAPGLSKGAFE